MKLLSLTTIVASLLTGVLARSTVYMVSNTVQPAEHKQPEVSLDDFSLFYSDMMDNTHTDHSALRLQDSSRNMNAFLPQTDDLFEKKLEGNLVVVVSGVQAPEAIFSTQDASFYVSDDEPESYFSMVQEVAHDITEKNSDVVVVSYDEQQTEIRQGSDVVKGHQSINDQDTFNKEFETELFNIENEADKMLINEMEDLKHLYANGRQQGSIDIRMIKINSLQAIFDTYGSESEQYKEAQRIIQDLIQNTLIPDFQGIYSRGVSSFILTPATKQSYKHNAIRQLIATGNEQVCHKTSSACKKNTSDCSGNGHCIKVEKDCYACQCRSSSYMGESCQYVNAVGDFQLLFWTSVLLIVITASVVVCVYQSGNIVDGGIIMTQSVPKQE
ncbi:hypothetical protein EDC96DRAFT_494747 [Choanephora cucurbitarum]|nr:hypothetical protein EDC96DRAFT_494747 [Choanephora cucurbitarum]